MNKDILEQQVQFTRQLLNKNPGKKLALATYTPEEFAEIRRGESYEDFKLRERLFIERLTGEGISADQIEFVEVDSVGFYEFIGKNGMPNNEGTRAAYARYKAQKEFER